jgi:hypothetical protein
MLRVACPASMLVLVMPPLSRMEDAILMDNEGDSGVACGVSAASGGWAVLRFGIG